MSKNLRHFLSSSKKPTQETVKLLHSATLSYQLNYITGQAAFMESKGFDVAALASPDELLDEFGLRESVPVFGVSISRNINPLADLGSIARFIGKIKAYRPTIVHSHTPKGALIGMIAAAIARVPIRIYNIHGLPTSTATGFKHFLLTCSEKMTCALASRVICVSESVRKMATEQKLCKPEKIVVLRSGSINGIDGDDRFNPSKYSEERIEVRSKYGIPENAVVAGFVGRLGREKGLVELSEAFAYLRKKHPRLHLMIVGPFEPRDPLPQEVEHMLRNDPRIHLTGLEWDTPKLYAAMDIFVLPSYREGFPVVTLEASSMALPIITTFAPGCVDAVEDNVNGTLIPVGDSSALANAMERYLTDEQIRIEHGRAGRERVLQDFRREDVWKSIYEEYVRLLESKGLRHLIDNKE
jgi:glycosyltransferase involved in cell wall biosynthesis